MRAVDEVLLERVRENGENPFDVHDGYFDARPPEGVVVVTTPLPYAIYMSSIGDDDEETRRMSAHIPRQSVFFTFIYVGLDRNQAKWAGERLRARLRRYRPTVDGFVCEVVQLLESQRVRRDDEAIRPDGSPLFYGVDNYAVGVRTA